MKINDKLNNVININTRKADVDNSCKKKEISYARVMAITSGKGGVGKTNIVVNLGFSLSKMGKKVLILDADLGLGNIDVLLGIAPKYNLSHVIMGEKKITDIVVKGPGNMMILPASSGLNHLTNIGEDQRCYMLAQLDSLIEQVDILLIDTAAGISSNVIFFNVSAEEIIVVVSPEPTSMTDAYALMKVLSLQYSEKNFKLIVNSAHTINEADDVFKQLNLVTDRFLDITIEYLGYVLYDKKLTHSVKRQKIVTELFPDAISASCFNTIAKKIYASSPLYPVDGASGFFWKNLFPKSL
jgi:flagellar biosynthesis protein FlhG